MEVVNKNWVKCGLIALFCVVMMALVGCEPSSLVDLKHNQRLTLKGVLTQVGNVPFQEPALRVKRFDYTLPLVLKHVSMEKEIMKKMGKKVQVTGVIRITTLNDSPEARKNPSYSFVVHRIKS